MIVQGILHLLTGYDHLAFLLVVLLNIVRQTDANDPHPLRTKMIASLKVVTAFTVAHSITLALAATGTVVLASKPVEASIAATVAITALAGLWRPTVFHGWPLAFAFGLVHGFGFAGALTELVGGSISAMQLGAFNIGIELGQLAVAAIAIPALWWLARKQAFNRIAPAVSVAVAIVAMGWFVERIAL